MGPEPAGLHVYFDIDTYVNFDASANVTCEHVYCTVTEPDGIVCRSVMCL